MNNPTLELQIQTLPDGPGVYQYYDKEGKILYVGKAKNLKKRFPPILIKYTIPPKPMFWSKRLLP
jgi:excinuclease UvrABC nuclease subunit